VRTPRGGGDGAGRSREHERERERRSPEPVPTPVHHPSAWGTSAGVCVAVRERLTEYALATLPPDERAFVDRHLEWCAGCRKEAGVLGEAASWVGFSTDSAEPPAGLEERIVRRVQASADRRGPWRQRLRVLSVATAVALLVAVLGVGWGVAMFAQNQSNQDKIRRAVQRQHELTEAIDRVVRSFISGQRSIGQGPHDELLRTQLEPTGSSGAAASAVVYLSPGQSDWALVVAANLPRQGLPYRVLLTDGQGRSVLVGTIHARELVQDGTASLSTKSGIYRQSLRVYDRVVIRDAHHHTVLAGRLDRSPPTPGAPNV
jgi:Putative zinc-finger